MDAAFFGNTVANGPSGLQSLASVSTVDGGRITNLDAFAEAVSTSEVGGQQITS